MLNTTNPQGIFEGKKELCELFRNKEEEKQIPP